MNNTQTVSREEYRRLDNRVTCILQQRWPDHEISQWVDMLKGKQQSVACAAGTLAQHSLPCQPSPQRCRTRFSPTPTAPPCRSPQPMAAL